MIEKIIDIAVEAGKIITKVRKEGFKTKIKSNIFDFVTSADLKSEKYIIERLKNEFPKDSILTEEKGKAVNNNNSRVWMVDPLDGTKDFKNGGSGFSVMIGLCVKNKPSLGVVYAPAKNLLYYAQKGKGAYLRIDGKNKKLLVSKIKNLKDSKMVTRIIAGEKRPDDEITESFKVKEKIPESSVGVKLGLIAEKKADFSVSSNATTSKWDTCAPQAILEESGGKITDWYGNALNYNQPESKWPVPFIASNGVLHFSIIEKIRSYKRIIKVVAFDFGGVIYNYNHKILMRDIAREIKQPVKMVTSAWKVKINEYELGKVSEDEFWNAFLGKIKINHDKKNLHKIVINHFQPIPESLKILKSLNGKVVLGLISNQTSWIEDLEKKYKFKKIFNILVVSKDVALQKPSKEIFNLFIKKAKMKPYEIVFIDDSLNYKKATENVGINFIHFKNPKTLKIDLKKYGIKLV